VSAEYPFLNTIGVASINGVNPFLLIQLNKLGQQLGKPIDVFSGYRSPGYSERVGGYSNDPHSRGEAVDAQIGGTPIGMVVPVATLAALGLEGGNTPGFYPRGGNGGRDPEHVQIPGSGVDKSMRSPALHLATGNPASGNVPPTTLASATPQTGDPLATTLAQAGFSGEGLRTAYAIAKRESGGSPTAFNGNAATGDKSYGLFQINMLGSMGPARRAQFGIASNDALFDPAVNAKAAFQMSKGGTDFGAWGLGPNAYRHVPLDMSVVPANLPAAASGATLLSAALPASAGTAGTPPPPVVPYVPPPPPDLPAYTPPPPATPITLLPAPPATAATPPPTVRQGAPPPYDPANDRALAPAEPTGPLRRLYPVAKLDQAAAPLPGGGSGGPLRRLFPVSKLGRG
jgi:hypothetical protein